MQTCAANTLVATSIIRKRMTTHTCMRRKACATPLPRMASWELATRTACQQTTLLQMRSHQLLHHSGPPHKTHEAFGGARAFSYSSAGVRLWYTTVGLSPASDIARKKPLRVYLKVGAPSGACVSQPTLLPTRFYCTTRRLTTCACSAAVSSRLSLADCQERTCKALCKKQHRSSA